MKNIIHKPLCFKLLYLMMTFGAIAFSNVSWAAQESSAKIVNTINPSKSVGIQIGDLLNREIEIEVSKPYQISKNAFPVKGANQDGVELNDIKVETKKSDQKTTYKIRLTYQVFGYSAKPTVMQLPAEHIAVSGNNQTAFSVDIPAWRFWQASLVPTGIKNAKDNVQPQYKPTLIDLRQHQIKLITLFSMLIVGAIGLIYINADKQWLPFMNGAFAQAHRKIKKLNKDKASEQKALLYMHQAFNKIHGANLFASDVKAFILANPAYASMQTEIINFFERSNAALFSDQNENSATHINALITLSKALRNCERGVK
ncbi:MULTISPECIES: hypothetical protein [Methylotenera]|uniref:hypothetical protein n=1 Tax=Methylotenera TaxID=359407 RepID=UPI0003732FF6|nr:MULTISPECIES: hypothetical protein [Methylotenera]